MPGERHIDHVVRGQLRGSGGGVAAGAGEAHVDHVVRGQLRGSRADRLIAALAARQHGVVARRQLLDAGLSRRSIEIRLAADRLHPLYRGVYAVGHPLVGARGRWLATVLAAGPDAVLSHRAAAALWGIAPVPSGAVDLISPLRGRRPGVRRHHVALAADERTTHDGVPVTTVARTIVDLAAVVRPDRVARAVHEAELRQLGDVTGLRALVDRHAGRRGIAALRAVLDDLQLGAQLTRSELETAFLAFVARHELPRPQANLPVEGFVADAAWPEQRLVVELDGHATHVTRLAFERDRLRDRVLQRQGWRVVRVTHRQLTRDPRRLAADLRTLLEGTGSGRPSPGATPARAAQRAAARSGA